jgi:hypothetical protein
MASKIQAVNAYRPRIKLGKTAAMPELVPYIADRTGLNEGTISMVLKELRDAVIFFARSGRGTKIEGLGTYLPKVSLDGRFNVSHRLDAEIKNALNTPGAFRGQIEHRENIGQTADDLVDLWNTDNPGDSVS